MVADESDILVPRKILLVEDDLLLAGMFEKNLKSANYSVTTVYDGGQVHDLVKQHLFDLVFLDIRLPNKDGFTILKEIKNDPKTKNVPVIMITNLGEVEHMDRALRLGAADYVIKANTTPKAIRALANKHLIHFTARSNTERD